MFETIICCDDKWTFFVDKSGISSKQLTARQMKMIVIFVV
jgi:hypothetical protein